MLIPLLLSLLPSPLHVRVRRMLGARIGDDVRIGFGTLLAVDQLELGDGVRIGPFSAVRARRFSAGAYTQVKSFSLLKASQISLGSYVHIAPTAVVAGDLTDVCRIEVGDHSRIFPFCWLEPGEGITIGKHVGIGGHSLIFTHGAWSDYLRGGPVSYGPVVIEDRVWLPWRVFILANVRIGHDAIVGAGSVVTKNVPPAALAAGMPAKVVSDNVLRPLDAQQRRERAEEILREYATRSALAQTARIAVDDPAQLRRGDLLMVVNAEYDPTAVAALLERGINVLDHPAGELLVAQERPYVDDFMGFLRRYGIRLSRERVTVRQAPAPEPVPAMTSGAAR